MNRAEFVVLILFPIALALSAWGGKLMSDWVDRKVRDNT